MVRHFHKLFLFHTHIITAQLIHQSYVKSSVCYPSSCLINLDHARYPRTEPLFYTKSLLELQCLHTAVLTFDNVMSTVDYLTNDNLLARCSKELCCHHSFLSVEHLFPSVPCPIINSPFFNFFVSHVRKQFP